jgi:hypothetical protein
MRIRTYIFICLAWSLAAATATKGATSPKAEPNSPFDPVALFNRVMSGSGAKAGDSGPAREQTVTRMLWRGRIRAPQFEEDAGTQDELERLIQRVRSVKFASKERSPAPAVVFQPEVTNNPNDVPAPANDTAGRAAEPAPVAATADANLPPGRVETLKHLLADPNQVYEPLETAELLFLSGRLPEAAAFYQRALDLTATNEPAAREDRAWAFLQLGNCLRDTDSTRAKDAYAKLTTDYADSPWAELAKAHSQLLTWYESVQPRRLIAGRETQPTESTATRQPKP